MSPSIDDLVRIVQGALRGDAFALDFTGIDSAGAKMVAGNFFPDSTLRLQVADPGSAVQLTPNGKGVTVSPAVGIDLPFTNLQCALHVFLTGEIDDPIGFELHGSPLGEWSLGAAFPLFAQPALAVLPFKPTPGVPAITLQSNLAGGDPARPLNMSLDAVLDLVTASAGISTFLGLQNIRLAGTIDLQREGSRLWNFSFSLSSPVHVDLGLAEVNLNVRLGMRLVYDPWKKCFGALPALYFDADFPFKANGNAYAVPLHVEILSFDDPITCTVDLSGIASAALDEMAKLLSPPGEAPPDLKSLLPAEIAKSIVDAANPKLLTIVIDPTSEHQLASVELTMQPKASWPLFLDVTAEIDELSVLSVNPTGNGSALAVTLRGGFTLGTHGLVRISAGTASGFEVQGYLDEGSSLALGDIPGFPDGVDTALGALAIRQLQVDYSGSAGYSFVLFLDDPWPIDIGGSQFVFEEVQVSVNGTVQPAAISLAGRFTLAGFPLILSANRGGDGAWTLTGATPASIPVSQALGWLQLFLPVQLPLPIDNVSLADVSLRVKHGAGTTALGLSATLMAEETAYAYLGLFAEKGIPSWTYALTAQLAKSLDLSQLDVIGPALSGDALFNAQVSCISGSLTAAEKSLLATLLPNGPAPSDTAVAGLSFTAAATLASEPYVIGRDLVVPAGAPPAPAPAPSIPSPGTGGYAAAAPPATDATIWHILDKSFGVAHLDRVGLRYSNDTLYLMLDAELSAGPVIFGLDGLGIGLDLKTMTPALTLDGLEAGFSSAGIALSGALIHTGGQYEGTLTLDVAGFNIAAFGAYASPNGTPSFFAYAIVRDRPLGGPPFFFVTGLAAGIGYNRKLKLPPIDQITCFPLIQAAMPGDGGPLVLAGSDPLTILNAFGPDWISESPGDNWLAAGVTFSSFEMIKSTAVLTLTAGPKALLSLIGLSDLSFPTGAPNPIANAQVALLAVLDPEAGDLSTYGKLTPASYVLSPDARLSGGFAFNVWFASGDFVVTFGGYHPRFQKPAAYPDVPRLEMNWQVSDHLSVVASEYFALTPAAIMAGGFLSAVWSSGSLTAWFDVEANFLLLWKPFSYSIDASINIGASFELDLLFFSITVTIHVGVDLTMRGPPFGGTARVDLDIISFSIDFGADPPKVRKLRLDEFVTSFLPHPASANGDAVICAVHVTAGLVKTLPQSNVLDGETALSALINPQLLGIAVRCMVPLLTIEFGDPAGKLEDPHASLDPTAGLGIAPVGAQPGQWSSVLNLTITKAGDVPDSDVYRKLRFEAVRTAAPKALWGTADIGDPKQSSEALGSEQTVGQVLFGVQITAHQFVPDFTQTVLLQTLLYNATDPVVVTLANTALPAPIQVSHKDVASTISAAKAQRAAVLAAMQARGHGVGLRPAAIHVSQLAAGHGRLLDSPIEQEIA